MKHRAKITLLLPLMVLVVGIDACGRSTGNRSRDRAEQAFSNYISGPPIQGHRASPHVSVGQACLWTSRAREQGSETATDRSRGSRTQHPLSNTENAECRIQNPDKPGTENPFMPLLVGYSDGKKENGERTDEPMQGKPDTGKPIEAPVIRLTATVNGTKAIVEEGGVSRSISVGDKIAGMRVVEIRRGEITLDGRNKKRIVKLGVLPNS